MYRFSATSRYNLMECHPDLITLAKEGLWLSYKLRLYDFGISDGGRWLSEQRLLKASGASKTLKSRHRFARPLTKDGRINYHYKKPVSHAFDHFIVINGKARWEPEPYIEMWRRVWLPLSKKLGIPISGGYFWKWDYPHIQLSWKHYPARYVDEPETIAA